ncbi:MAG: hypothetical protein IH969_07130, partial [Candidatus Krumholzibacteriota bacterium]|nr:hypothetical protein [Candidatus Krumholzibacteriota bacterium]
RGRVDLAALVDDVGKVLALPDDGSICQRCHVVRHRQGQKSFLCRDSPRKCFDANGQGEKLKRSVWEPSRHGLNGKEYANARHPSFM